MERCLKKWCGDWKSNALCFFISAVWWRHLERARVKQRFKKLTSHLRCKNKFHPQFSSILCDLTKNQLSARQESSKSPENSMRQHEFLWFATRSAFTNTSNRHDDLSSTLGQSEGYFDTAVSRHKWVIHSVPLRDPLPKPSSWGLLASVSKIRQRLRDLGRVKSKAKAWHLLKCHTVYFICMWGASEPERLPSCRQQRSPYWHGRDGRRIRISGKTASWMSCWM